jgi:DNA-binding PadR family transcriptional regulator
MNHFTTRAVQTRALAAGNARGNPESNVADNNASNLTENNAIAGFLPMSAVEFAVLLALAEGARHGYAIVKDIEARSGGQVSLLPGNLYAILQRLAESGLIERTRPAAVNDGSADKRRRYYRITALGRRVAAAEAARMKRMVEAAAASNLLEDPAQ